MMEVCKRLSNVSSQQTPANVEKFTIKIGRQEEVLFTMEQSPTECLGPGTRKSAAIIIGTRYTYTYGDM